MIINLIIMVIGIFGLYFSIKTLKVLLLARKFKPETYSNKVSVLTKMEVQERNRQRLYSHLFG